MIAKVVIYKDTVGEWRLSAKAANGEQIVGSSEGYKNRSYAVDVAERVFPFVPLVDENGVPLKEEPMAPPLSVLRAAEIASKRQIDLAIGKVELLIDAAKAVVEDGELEAHEAFADLRDALEPFRT